MGISPHLRFNGDLPERAPHPNRRGLGRPASPWPALLAFRHRGSEARQRHKVTHSPARLVPNGLWNRSTAFRHVAPAREKEVANCFVNSVGTLTGMQTRSQP